MSEIQILCCILERTPKLMKFSFIFLFSIVQGVSKKRSIYEMGEVGIFLNRVIFMEDHIQITPDRSLLLGGKTFSYYFRVQQGVPKKCPLARRAQS